MMIETEFIQIFLTKKKKTFPIPLSFAGISFTIVGEFCRWVIKWFMILDIMVIETEST